MTAKYFSDTDTLFLEFRASEVVETRDLDEETLLDYDAAGNVVGIAVEHANNRVGGAELQFETITA